MKTLIAYATKGGVTEESANVIADVLRTKHDFEVDLVNLRKKRSPDLTPYKNIFIGSGIRMGRWYKVALKFLENNFEGKNVVIFLSSCSAGNPEKHEEAMTKYINDVLVKYPHVKPIVAEAFGGRMKMLGKTVEDNFDMDKVRAWVEEVGKKLTESNDTTRHEST
jgi:menaquinone-dependent protoporphyrinogen oxidase